MKKTLIKLAVYFRDTADDPMLLGYCKSAITTVDGYSPTYPRSYFYCITGNLSLVEMTDVGESSKFTISFV